MLDYQNDRIIDGGRMHDYLWKLSAYETKFEDKRGAP